MQNVIMEYGEFRYESEPDEDYGEVTKYMHYVFWNQEFVGMIPHSSYELCPTDKFHSYCDELLKKNVSSE